jgi:hypothetical protein
MNEVSGQFRELDDLLDHSSEHRANAEAVAALITPQQLSMLCSIKQVGTERFYRCALQSIWICVLIPCAPVATLMVAWAHVGVTVHARIQVVSNHITSHALGRGNASGARAHKSMV